MVFNPKPVSAFCCNAVLAVLVAGLLSACAGKEELVHGLTEFEANQIVYVLEADGIKAKKEVEEGGRTITYKVEVGGGDAQAGRRILVDNQLPRPAAMGFNKIYDPANKGLIPTATEEEASFLMALQGEIVNKLKSIPGVVDAHVTVVKPKKDVVRDLMDKPAPPTASVTIIYNKVNDKPPFEEEKVRKLVASSVEGLNWENVTVLATENKATTLQMIMSNPDEEGVSAADTSRMPNVMGVVLANPASKKKLMTYLGGLGVAFAVALLAFLITVGAYAANKKKMTSMVGELTSLKRARKAEAAPPPG